MKIRPRFFATSAVVASVIVAVLALNSHAQVEQGKSRPMTTKHWMKGVMKPHCTNLKEGLEAGPSDEKAWEALAVHAGLLSESSYILMADGRCPDGVWADAATKKLREGSAEALKAIAAKDLEAARVAFKKLASSCKACHTKHKE